MSEYLHICSRNLSDILIKLVFTSLMCSLSDVKKQVPPDGPWGLGNVFSRLNSMLAFWGFFLTSFSALTPGGGPEERRRAQIRPPFNGAARVHRGVCSCARRLFTDGPRHGGGQKVPVSCESVCCPRCSVSILTMINDNHWVIQLIKKNLPINADWVS